MQYKHPYSSRVITVDSLPVGTSNGLHEPCPYSHFKRQREEIHGLVAESSLVQLLTCHLRLSRSARL